MNIHLQDFVSTFSFNLGLELLGRRVIILWLSNCQTIFFTCLIVLFGALKFSFSRGPLYWFFPFVACVFDVISKNPLLGFPDGSVIKNLPVNAGDTGCVLDPGRSLDHRKITVPREQWSPLCHDYWACALEPMSHSYWSLRSAARETTATGRLHIQRVTPCLQLEKSAHRNKKPPLPKIKLKKKGIHC